MRGDCSCRKRSEREARFTLILVIAGRAPASHRREANLSSTQADERMLSAVVTVRLGSKAEVDFGPIQKVGTSGDISRKRCCVATTRAESMPCEDYPNLSCRRTRNLILGAFLGASGRDLPQGPLKDFGWLPALNQVPVIDDDRGHGVDAQAMIVRLALAHGGGKLV
jgi:hypothetical protein